jgi:D-alanyl-lipoteichoic acid acyltransferase DltB (MBOAT superfamily)
MWFNSLAFALFLPIVLGGYYALSRRAQNVWLLVASYVFYGWWDVRFLSLLALSTVVDFVCGRRIHASAVPRVRRTYLIVSLVTNLGVLGCFKYFDFFVDSTCRLLSALGMHASTPVLNIVLPVGISFYTFQTLSYTIDVYRRRCPPCDNLIDFGLFVSFFPQLVAGPIERAVHLLPQFQNPRTVDWRMLREGGLLILLGYFKKVGVADALAPLVQWSFADPAHTAGSQLLVALYLFSFQIYCDFSGYSNIARGVARLLGIELMENFRQPYLSQSLQEFWRRWHISLSTWLRDYLYIPLGGNRAGSGRTYLNLMITMLLGGLWHGAAWTFVAWGGLHGTYLVVGRWYRQRRKGPLVESADPAPGPLGVLWKIFFTFHLVALTWIFFRAASFGIAADYLKGVLTWQGGSWHLGHMDMLRATVLVGLVVAIDLVQNQAGDQVVMLRWPAVRRGVFYGVLAVVMVMLGGIDAPVPFIYFQF